MGIKFYIRHAMSQYQKLEKIFSNLKFRRFKHSQPKKTCDLLIKDHEGNYAVMYFESKEKGFKRLTPHPFGIAYSWTYLDFYAGLGWGIPGKENEGIFFLTGDVYDDEEITFSDRNPRLN